MMFALSPSRAWALCGFLEKLATISQFQAQDVDNDISYNNKKEGKLHQVNKKVHYNLLGCHKYRKKLSGSHLSASGAQIFQNERENSQNTLARAQNYNQNIAFLSNIARFISVIYRTRAIISDFLKISMARK